MMRVHLLDSESVNRLVLADDALQYIINVNEAFRVHLLDSESVRLVLTQRERMIPRPNKFTIKEDYLFLNHTDLCESSPT